MAEWSIRSDGVCTIDYSLLWNEQLEGKLRLMCASVLLRRNLTTNSGNTKSSKSSTTHHLLKQQGLVFGRCRQSHFNLLEPRCLFEYWTSLERSTSHAHMHRLILLITRGREFGRLDNCNDQTLWRLSEFRKLLYSCVLKDEVP